MTFYGHQRPLNYLRFDPMLWSKRKQLNGKQYCDLLFAKNKAGVNYLVLFTPKGGNSSWIESPKMFWALFVTDFEIAWHQLLITNSKSVGVKIDFEIS
jgi:hypothetical protein